MDLTNNNFSFLPPLPGSDAGLYSNPAFDFPVQHNLSFHNPNNYFSMIHPDPYFTPDPNFMIAGESNFNINNINIDPHYSITASLVPDNRPVMVSFHALGPESDRSGSFSYPVGFDHDQDQITGKKAVAMKSKRKCKNVLEMKRTGKGYKLTSIIKGQWTSEEDRMLKKLVERFGVKKWAKIGQWMPGRLGKQCRERWINHLQPNIKKDAWSEEEEAILIENHKKIGNRWATIARKLPGRTDNTVKNHWNAAKRKQTEVKHRTTKPSKNKKPKSCLLKNYINTILLSQPSSSSSSSSFTLSPPEPKPLVPEPDANMTPAGALFSDHNAGAWGTYNHDVFESNMFDHDHDHNHNDNVNVVVENNINVVGEMDMIFDMLPEISSLMTPNDVVVVGGVSEEMTNETSSSQRDMDLWEMMEERAWR